MIDAKTTEADYDAATIRLYLKIADTSFVQADTISQLIIESLKERINFSFATEQTHPLDVKQVSQTLVPA